MRSRTSSKLGTRRLDQRLRVLAAVLAVATCTAAPSPAQTGSTAGSNKQAQTTATTAPGVPFSAEKLASLLPPSVYFEGRSAPLQIRNAGGTTFAGGTIVWISLVDSSGYASGIQEKYQFYLVTEGPLRIGDAKIAPGAYGGGFVGDRFELMDLGGHTVAQGPVQTDAELRRPRPLQVLPESSTAVKLVLGRRFVRLQSAPGQ